MFIKYSCIRRKTFKKSLHILIFIKWNPPFSKLLDPPLQCSIDLVNFSFTRLLIFYFDLDLQIEHQLIFLSCSQLFSFIPISFRQEWKKLYDTFLMLHHDVIKFVNECTFKRIYSQQFIITFITHGCKNRVQIRRCYSDNQLGSLIKAIAQTKTAPDYKSNTFF